MYIKPPFVGACLRMTQISGVLAGQNHYLHAVRRPFSDTWRPFTREITQPLLTQLQDIYFCDL